MSIFYSHSIIIIDLFPFSFIFVFCALYDANVLIILSYCIFFNFFYISWKLLFYLFIFLFLFIDHYQPIYLFIDPSLNLFSSIYLPIYLSVYFCFFFLTLLPQPKLDQTYFIHLIFYSQITYANILYRHTISKFMRHSVYNSCDTFYFFTLKIWFLM